MNDPVDSAYYEKYARWLTIVDKDFTRGLKPLEWREFQVVQSELVEDLLKRDPEKDWEQHFYKKRQKLLRKHLLSLTETVGR